MPGPHPDHDGRLASPVRTPPPGLQGAVLAAVSYVVSDVTTVVKPAAAVSVASTFSFPLVLMVFVLLFLFVQPHVDRRDPKLRARRSASVETNLGFQEEDQL
jgi:hypothetical protein